MKPTTSGEGKKLLARDEPHYIVVVSGMPAPMLALFRNSEAITAKTFLKRKKKENIVATRVEAKPVGQLLDVSFWFPRTAAVTLEDKDVEFETRIGRLKIKRKFRLKDKVLNGELSLQARLRADPAGPCARCCRPVCFRISGLLCRPAPRIAPRIPCPSHPFVNFPCQSVKKGDQGALFLIA